jgi:hypothetical protein
MGRRSEGIGLGLAVTRRLVALHRGSITLESQVGQGSGSTFHVYLPLPSLNGQPVLIPPAAKPVLLVISSRPYSPASVNDLHLHVAGKLVTSDQGMTWNKCWSKYSLWPWLGTLAHAVPGDWETDSANSQPAGLVPVAVHPLWSGTG